MTSAVHGTHIAAPRNACAWTPCVHGRSCYFGTSTATHRQVADEPAQLRDCSVLTQEAPVVRLHSQRQHVLHRNAAHLRTPTAASSNHTPYECPYTTTCGG